MKRRSTGDERAQLEREAMAELQQQGGGQPRRPSPGAGVGRPAWGASAPPAWGAGAGAAGGAAPEAAPEPAWRTPAPAARPERPRRSGRAQEWELPEELAAPAADADQEEADDEEEWGDEEGYAEEGEAVGLLGIPLDYDATGIALQQLADRSNVRRPVASVMGVDASEAGRIRDQAMAQFLERQKIRAAQDAELAAARAAASPPAGPPQKRAAFPPLSPGLSAKSLVMQPVAAPPLYRPSPPEAPSGRAKPASRRSAAAGGAAGEIQVPGARKAATKKAITKKAVTRPAPDGAPRGRAATPARSPRPRPARTQAVPEAPVVAEVPAPEAPVTAKKAATRTGTQPGGTRDRKARPATAPAAPAAGTAGRGKRSAASPREAAPEEAATAAPRKVTGTRARATKAAPPVAAEAAPAARATARKATAPPTVGGGSKAGGRKAKAAVDVAPAPEAVAAAPAAKAARVGNRRSPAVSTRQPRP